MVSGVLLRSTVCMLICGIYTAYTATVYSTSMSQYTTGLHLVVMKPGISSGKYSDWYKKELMKKGADLTIRYNISVLRHFSIGNWGALLVDFGDNGLNDMAGEENIDFIEPEIKVMAYPLHEDSNYTVVINEQRPTATTESYENLNQTTPEPVTCYQQIPGFSGIWALQRISSHARPINYIQDEYLFTSADNGEGADVYVLDTGIRTSHQEFRGRASLGHVAAGMGEGPDDNNGHGTHVSSLVAGDTVGIAKQARTISVKVLRSDGMGDVSWIIDGLEWIADRVAYQRSSGMLTKAIINLSLEVAGVAYSLEAAIQAVIDEMDIVVVAAAGNGERDACSISPARMSSVITVGATASDDTLTSFSNYGSCVNLLAPGDEVLGAHSIGDDTYRYISGTSQATALASGVLARYISSLDGVQPTPALLKAYITDTASEGYIYSSSDLPGGTPNKLLYRACESMANDNPDLRVVYPYTSGSNSLINITPILITVCMYTSYILY